MHLRSEEKLHRNKNEETDSKINYSTQLFIDFIKILNRFCGRKFW